MKKETRDTTVTKKTSVFLDLAYTDYVAARVLLNSGLPVQGAILASTAIEKYLKAILAFRGRESHGHLKKGHWNAAKDFDKGLWSVLSEDFLKLLQKVYKLRYTDDLVDDFNLVIASAEFLAELDHTAITIQDRFQFEKSGRPLLLAYHQDRNHSEPKLVHNNCILAETDKHGFSSQAQLVYEMRNSRRMGLLEVRYTVEALASAGEFMRPGLVPVGGSGDRHQLALLGQEI